jgi:hypothetical protein
MILVEYIAEQDIRSSCDEHIMGVCWEGYARDTSSSLSQRIEERGTAQSMTSRSQGGQHALIPSSTVCQITASRVIPALRTTFKIERGTTA